MITECKHNLDQMRTAILNGLCPICMQAKYERLLQKHRWIPVDEKLPEESGAYQVIRKKNHFPTTREYIAKNKYWNSHDTVTHWKEIISPDEALKETE